MIFFFFRGCEEKQLVKAAKEIFQFRFQIMKDT